MFIFFTGRSSWDGASKIVESPSIETYYLKGVTTFSKSLVKPLVFQLTVEDSPELTMRLKIFQ